MRADETPAAELWNRTVLQIRSIFGRLVYLASLRDPNSGVYQHFGFSQRFNEKIADKTIARSHQNVFADWLCLSLEQQKSDLELYLDSLDADRGKILANWREWAPYMSWIPSHTRAADRELYRSDLEIIVEVIRPEADGASKGRIA
jgi:hypothetical protein